MSDSDFRDFGWVPSAVSEISQPPSSYFGNANTEPTLWFVRGNSWELQRRQHLLRAQCLYRCSPFPSQSSDVKCSTILKLMLKPRQWTAPRNFGWASGAISQHVIGETIWCAGRHKLVPSCLQWPEHICVEKERTHMKSQSDTVAGNLKSRILFVKPYE